MDGERPLSFDILICDADRAAAGLLLQAIRTVEPAITVDIATEASALQERFDAARHNVIFIDPLTIGLEDAAGFIFGIRKTLPDQVVFVLFINKQVAESDRAKFYRGERSRFAHYITLDKCTPATMFGDEAAAVLARCRIWLHRLRREKTLKRVESRASELFPVTSAAVEPAVVAEMREMIGTLRSLFENHEPNRFQHAAGRSDVIKDSVFVSYDFNEQLLADGLISLLTLHHFTVQTGARANTYISRTILDRIASCEYFVSLMTRHEQKPDGTYTTSPWLIEEKGAALALGKAIVLLVETGVGANEIGGLQGDWQRIEFGQRGYTTAALQAVEQLKSYAGKSDRRSERAPTRSVKK
jgi:hypothetical protein